MEVDMELDGEMDKLEKIDLAEAAAATGFRNFRHSPDVEGFYRFVYENDLREEAKVVLEKVVSFLGKSRKKKKLNQ